MKPALCLPEDMLPSLQGVIPSVIASSSAEGVPNITFISQVYYVDENHVALSQQFFSKTVRNIAENPQATVAVTCPVTYKMFKLFLLFKESIREGAVFENMRLQLEAIAGMQGQTGNFLLKSADIFEVVGIETIYDPAA